MWLYIIAFVLSHIGDGEVFGPRVWYVCNDLCVIGSLLMFFPRILGKHHLDDPATSYFVRRTGVGVFGLGWVVATFATGRPALTPFDHIVDGWWNLVGASDTASEVGFADWLGLGLATLLLASLLVTAIRGLLNTPTMLTTLAAPFNSGRPDDAAMTAPLKEGEIIHVSLMWQYKVATIKALCVVELLVAIFVVFFMQIEAIWVLSFFSFGNVLLQTLQVGLFRSYSHVAWKAAVVALCSVAYVTATTYEAAVEEVFDDVSSSAPSSGNVEL